MPTSRAISPGCGVMITSRPSRPRSRSGSLGERVERIRIDDHRHRRAIEQGADELRRAGRAAEAGANRNHIARELEDAIDGGRVKTVGGLVDRLRHVFRRHRRHDRLTALWAWRSSRGPPPIAARRLLRDVPRRFCRATRRRPARDRNRLCGCRRLAELISSRIELRVSSSTRGPSSVR